MLTLLTTTGARPTAFSLCEWMMFRQSYDGPVTWIVVDDGPVEQPLSEIRRGWRRIVHRPSPVWSPGMNTQGRNLREGLALAKTDASDCGGDLRLVIIEDDDWYDPRWLAAIDQLLGAAPLAGEGNARFYNVAVKMCQQFDNKTYSSLRSTAMRGPALDLFETVISRPVKLFDMALWKAADDYAIDTGDLTIGMKAMPGRAGIAAGHDGMIGKHDFNGAILRHWVGVQDARIYERFSAIKEGDMMKLTAAKSFTYRTRRLTAGAPFEAPVGHGRYFVKSGRAILRREEGAAPPSSPFAKSDVGGTVAETGAETSATEVSAIEAEAISTDGVESEAPAQDEAGASSDETPAEDEEAPSRGNRKSKRTRSRKPKSTNSDEDGSSL